MNNIRITTIRYSIRGSKIIFILLFSFLFCEIAISQIFSDGEPIYKPGQDTNYVPQIQIDTKDLVKPQISGENTLKNNKFAHPINVGVNPEEYGVWVNVPQLNKRIWLLSIKAENASSLNLILSPFNLVEGAKLFFYDSLQTQIVGAITSRNNKNSNVLPVSIIKSDLIYCELQLPDNQKDYGDLTISTIGVGFPSPDISLKGIEDRWFGTSASCNINVNCYDFSGLKKQKQSVCRIIYEGTGRCTGTLINNLRDDETPYIITAAHCIRTEKSANEAIFYFNYESPDCSNIDVAPVSISGATLVSAGFHNPNPLAELDELDTLDFALLKLSEKPPLNYNVYYSGWDATNTPPDSIYVIHHPLGDIKKISVDSEIPVTGNMGLGFELVVVSH